MDALFLSRIQFGLTSAFHFLYPPMSIGLGLLLVIFEGSYMKTRNPLYKQIAKFWTKVFALTFAMGVATGLVQIFGFGTNWARYSRFVGDVFGSALGAEGIFAFFLEAGFVGVMLFGWDRFKPIIHYISTILVAAGAHFSAIWIIVANSWMQTPTGYRIVGDGPSKRAVVSDWWQMVLNPSVLDRLGHVILGTWLTGTFLVLSVSAYYMLKKRHIPFAKTCLKVGLSLAIIVLGLQLWSADSSARGVAKNQPPKLAAMEGVFTTQTHTPFVIMGWPDTKDKKTYGLKIPGLLSFLTYRNTTTPVEGLDQIPEGDWPPVPVVFFTYRFMIGMWLLMVMAALWGVFKWKRDALDKSPWLLRFLTLSVLFPPIANETGWFTAEIGRQPWVVYNVLRTADGVSPGLSAGQVLGSIIMFLSIYIALFFVFIFILNQKIQHGPEEEEDEQDLLYRDPYKARGV